MKKIFLLLGIFIFSCSNKTKESFVNSFSEKVDSKKSVAFNLEYKINFFSSETDTSFYKANCKLIKQKSDTLFGGLFWINENEIERYYDGEFIYLIDHQKRKITKFDPKKNQTWIINGNLSKNVLGSYFFDVNNFKNFIKKNQDKVTFSKEDNILLKINFEDDSVYTNRKSTFRFSKKKNLVERTFSVNFGTQKQFEKWTFKNHDYDVNFSFKKNFEEYLKKYSLEDFKRVDSKDLLLKNGEKIPATIGVKIFKNDTISLTKIKNKIFLLDFWYQDCVPCIKSIPYLNNFKKKYSNLGLQVFGLNFHDQNEKNKERLKEHIQNYNIDYQNLFISIDVLKNYGVSAFPTLFLIDKNGYVIYSQIGNIDENSKKAIEEILKNIL